MSILLALSSAVFGGSASFMGGSLTRRLSVYSVIGPSQLLALLLVGLAAWATDATALTSGEVPWALASGIWMLIGLRAFYAALAGGTMGVVAPIAALGILVPLIWGVARGESPSAPQVVGALVAVIGVVMSSGPEFRAGAGRRSVILGAIAALGFGGSTVCFGEASRSSPTVALMLMKVVIVGALVTVMLRRRREVFAVRPDRAAMAVLAGIATADVTANLCYGFAVRTGDIAVAGVLASLHPVTVVVLGRLVHQERLGVGQYVGIGTAIAGSVVIGLS